MGTKGDITGHSPRTKGEDNDEIKQEGCDGITKLKPGIIARDGINKV